MGGDGRTTAGQVTNGSGTFHAKPLQALDRAGKGCTCDPRRTAIDLPVQQRNPDV